MDSAKLRIKRFTGKGVDATLDASVVVNVIFDFSGLTPDEIIAIASGGQSPRVRYQDYCRNDLDRKSFLALDGTTQTVVVKDLYARKRERQPKDARALFMAMAPDAQGEFLTWALALVAPAAPVAPTVTPTIIKHKRKRS